MILILGICILFICFALGQRIIRCFRTHREPDEELVMASGIGLSVLAYAVLGLGLVHRLTPYSLWLLISFLALIACSNLRFSLECLRNSFRAWRVPRTPFMLLILSAGFITLIASWTGVMSPETATDSLCYHLQMVKLFFKSKTIGILPYELNTIHPILMEILYTLGMGLTNVFLAKFFHFATGILAAMTLLALARRYMPIQFAWIAAVFFITTPGIANELGTTYVDIAVTFFSLILFLGVIRWKETHAIFWLGIAGLFAGLCLSVKYLGILSIMSILPVLILDRSPFFSKFKGLLLFGAMLLIGGGFWYIRNFLFLGNPLYPFFYSIFKSGDPAVLNDFMVTGIPHTLTNFIFSPWTITMNPMPFGGTGDQIGPGYLAFGGIAFFATMGTPLFFSGFSFAMLYLFFWFFLGQMVRFIYPILPVIALLIALGLSRLPKGKGTRLIMTLMGLVLLIHTGLAVFHYRHNVRVALGIETEDAFLTRLVPNYAVSQFVNKEISEKSKLLAAEETRLYYFRPHVVRDIYYALGTHYSRLASPEKIIAQLKQEGFTHIFYSKQVDMKSPEAKDPYRVRSMIESGWLLPYLQLLEKSSYKNSEGTSIHWALYAIS